MADLVKAKYEDGVFWITLNRAVKLNALNNEMIRGLLSALEKAMDVNPRVIVLQGEGEHFCVGTDLEELQNHTTDFLLERKQVLDGISKILEMLHENPIPTMAIVRGSAYGVGMALALAPDLTICSETAVFSAAYAKVGITPHGSYLLTRLLGEKRAKYLVFTAARLTAPEALKMGVINKVFSDDELEIRAREIIGSIRKLPPQALSLAKEVLNYAATAPSLKKTLEFETLFQTVAFTSSEFKEVLSQFLEKSKETDQAKEKEKKDAKREDEESSSKESDEKESTKNNATNSEQTNK